MTWFWLIAGLLILATLTALLAPLRKQVLTPSPDKALPDPVRADRDAIVAVFRRQLAEIEGELESGIMAPDQAAAARAEVTRRMIEATQPDRLQPAARAGRNAGLSWQVGAIAAIAAVLPAGALAVYLGVGAPETVGGVAQLAAGGSDGSGSPHDREEMTVAAQRLTDRLKTAPDDVNSWVLLGRTLVSLERYGDARDAYAHAVALAPAEPELHAQLGELMVAEADGTVTPAALAEFGKAGGDPRSRYYGAEAMAQRGDVAAAKAALSALLADAPKDAPWRDMVAARIDELGPAAAAIPQVAAAPGAAPRGPTAADIAAAQSMAPDDRESMVRGMVDRLAARLQQEPDDRDGWTRLARAYDVLGQTDKAEAARKRAANAAPPRAPVSQQAAPQPQAAQPPVAATPGPDRPAVGAEADPAALLAAHLEAQPDDAEGWLKLARTYRIRGQADQALATLKRANDRVFGNEALLKGYLDALGAQSTGEKLPPELLEIAARLNAVNPSQPDALWYLGLAASQRNNRHEAETFWAQLLQQLPPDSSERDAVKRRLSALP